MTKFTVTIPYEFDLKLLIDAETPEEARKIGELLAHNMTKDMIVDKAITDMGHFEMVDGATAERLWPDPMAIDWSE